jgi:hypothetical protein
MKYKNIASAIHNLGHSFASLMNYVDGEYVGDELGKIHAGGHDIEIDWLTGHFSPRERLTPRIGKSIEYWRADLGRYLSSHRVDLKAIAELKLYWPARKPLCMVAVDDRGKEHKVYVKGT